MSTWADRSADPRQRECRQAATPASASTTRRPCGRQASPRHSAMSVNPPTPPSPESTGGRGTFVEHRYGGRLLAAVLSNAPIEGLPQGLVPVQVQFQGQTAVDDFVVRGESAGGEAVTWYVASRLRPSTGTSSPETVRLFTDYLQVIAAGLDAVSAGRTRLGLVAIDGHGPAVTLLTLTTLAETSAATFRATVERRASRYRGQLEHVDALVVAAAAGLGWPEEAPRRSRLDLDPPARVEHRPRRSRRHRERCRRSEHGSRDAGRRGLGTGGRLAPHTERDRGGRCCSRAHAGRGGHPARPRRSQHAGCAARTRRGDAGTG